MNENDVRGALLKRFLDIKHHFARNVKERLPRTHNIQIKIGNNGEYPQHLIQHTSMLPGHAHDHIELIPTGFKLVYKRAHFYCLRTRSEDEHDLPFTHIPRHFYNL